MSLLQMMDLDRDGAVSVDDFMVRLNAKRVGCKHTWFVSLFVGFLLELSAALHFGLLR